MKLSLNLLSDNILVQFTDHGRQILADKYGKGFFSLAIEPRQVIAEGKAWYKLRPLNLVEYFGIECWTDTDKPIEFTVLIP